MLSTTALPSPAILEPQAAQAALQESKDAKKKAKEEAAGAAAAAEEEEPYIYLPPGALPGVGGPLVGLRGKCIGADVVLRGQQP